MSVRAPHDAILVLGMHRSGTSAATRVLGLLGADLGTDLLAPAEDNIKGFWEHKDVVDIHEKLLAELGCSWEDVRSLPKGWERSEGARKAFDALAAVLSRDFSESRLWAVKDPRLCRLLPLWLPLANVLNVRFHALHVSRHPDEVAASLQARNGMHIEHARFLWMQHSVEANLASRGLPRALLPFEALLSDWKRSMSAVSTELGLTWPVNMEVEAQAVDEFLSPMERHHKARYSTQPPLPQLFQELCDAQSLLGDESRWRIIDACVDECEKAREAILPVFDVLYSRLSSAETQLSASQAHEQALAQKNKAISSLVGEIAGRLPGRVKIQGQNSWAKIYYRSGDEHFGEERSASCEWPEGKASATLVFDLEGAPPINFVRFDPAECAGVFEMSSMRINGVPLESPSNCVVQFNQYRESTSQGGVRFGSTDSDPYVELMISSNSVDARSIEIECRSISRLDEEAEAIDNLVAARLAPVQQVMARMLEAWQCDMGNLRTLIETEGQSAAQAKQELQEQFNTLDQRYHAISEQLQRRGLLGLFRRKR